MKRKFILLPITLTTLTPTIGLVGCDNSDTPTPPEPEVDININLTEDISEWRPSTESEPFDIDTNKIYKFNIDASICAQTALYWSDELGSFMIYEGSIEEGEFIGANIIEFVVRGKNFTIGTDIYSIDDGEYIWVDGLESWVYKDFKKIDTKFTMSIVLQFTDHDKKTCTARWGAGT